MATPAVCKIDGCDKRVLARGLCNGHYLRWYRHGDATAGAPTPTAPHVSRDWIQERLGLEDGPCLTWPFGRHSTGYGAMSNEAGVRVHAHRWVCEKVHGPAPTSEHVAAHSCGNGHLGCVHPRHLYWATDLENARDRCDHGRTPKGEDHVNAKLTEEQVIDIYRRRLSETQRGLAAEFGVSRAAIAWIHNGRSWAWLTGADAPASS